MVVLRPSSKRDFCVGKLESSLTFRSIRSFTIEATSRQLSPEYDEPEYGPIRQLLSILSTLPNLSKLLFLADETHHNAWHRAICDVKEDAYTQEDLAFFPKLEKLAVGPGYEFIVRLCGQLDHVASFAWELVGGQGGVNVDTENLVRWSKMRIAPVRILTVECLSGKLSKSSAASLVRT